MKDILSEVVSLQHVSKSFGAVKALEDVHLQLYAGEIHALVGENGAGKSTLMKILSGVYTAGQYAGEILLHGKSVRFQNPKQAEDAGIAIIHQELSAFPHLTVAENLFVGSWPLNHHMLDWGMMSAEAEKWLKMVGATFSPQTLMGSLSTGNQQLVEIAKCLSRNKKIIIFDEPTSSLTPKESENLFRVMNDLRNQGCVLVYISHRMEEIFRLCQRVTVLRDGKSIMTKRMNEITETELVTSMVGRALDRFFPEMPKREQTSVIFEFKNFMVIERSSGKRYGPFHFQLHEKEILGFSGLLGAGRSELFRALLGDPQYRTEGDCLFRGVKCQWSSPIQAYQSKIAYLSEDRKLESILTTRSLAENSRILKLALRGLVALFSPKKEDESANEGLRQMKTNYHRTEQLITELSGGNQQKVIFSRILQNNPEVIILDEPTRGVDVGAKFEIYQILQELVAQGKSILLVSSDLPELMSLSDRVIVFSGGQQMGTLAKNEINQNTIMKYAIGSEGAK